MSDFVELNDLPDDEFRLHVRQWIEANYPPEIRNPPSRLHFKDTKSWYHKLARKGWLCPNWPREFGGMGISAGKQLIMLEEKERHGCARINEMGMTMLGPLLIRYGTCRRSSPASTSGARAIPNRTPVPILRRCAPRPCRTATIGW